MKLTINKKLLLSFGTIMLMTITLGLYSFLTMKSINDNSTELYDVWTARVDLVHSIKNEVTIHKAREYKYISEEDSEKKDDILKSIDQNKENFNKLMDQYLENTISEDDKKLLYSVETEYNKFLEVSDQVINLVDQGKQTEAKELAFGLALQQTNSLTAEIDNLLNYNKENSVRVNLENQLAFKQASIIFAITTSVIVLISMLISFLMGTNLSKRIKLSTQIMKKTAELDLSYNHSLIDKYKKFKSNDELDELIQYIIQARLEIRTLVELVRNGSNNVALRTDNISEVIKETASSVDAVAKATDELALGTTHLAANAQNGVEKLENLSKQITAISNSSTVISKYLEKTSDSNTEGILCINDLQLSIDDNSLVTEKISQQVDLLYNNSNSIGKITDAINSITSQINLLSLNAAIEAARAGEQGRGFTVVSQEIRKLADETAYSNKQIEAIIVNIQNEINEVKSSMNSAKIAIEKTENSSKKTQIAFTAIDSSVKNIITHMDILLSNIKKIDADKNHVLNAIEGISAISQESASSTEEISASTEEQSASLEEISQASNELRNISSELDQNINRFKL